MSGVAGVQDARSSMSIELGRSARVPKLSDSTRVAVPPAERARFDAAIEALGYPATDETENPAYRLFLDGEAA